MNRSFLVACAGVFLALSANAEPPESLFQQGNQLYQQGNLEEAKTAYETILKQGFVSGELYYNLGNTYYKSGDIARAILSYERALRLMPRDEDLLHNLQLANLLITDRIEPAPRLFVWEYWDGIKYSVSLAGATWLAYINYLLIIAGLSVLMLARSFTLRKFALIGSGVCVVAFVFLAILFVSKASDARRRDAAILTTMITTAKNSPDAKSSDAFVLHSGVKVQLIDNVNEWVKIRLADGKVGWVESAAAEVI